MNRGEGVVHGVGATLASTMCRDAATHGVDGLGDRRDMRVHGVHFFTELP